MAAEDYHDMSLLGDFEYMNQYIEEPRTPKPFYGRHNYSFVKETLSRLKPICITLSKKEINMNNIRKFYVGAKHIANDIANGRNSEWTRATLEQAIAHGKDIMNDDESLDCVVIVKIVAVLKRKAQPIEVVKV